MCVYIYNIYIEYLSPKSQNQSHNNKILFFVFSSLAVQCDWKEKFGTLICIFKIIGSIFFLIVYIFNSCILLYTFTVEKTIKNHCTYFECKKFLPIDLIEHFFPEIKKIGYLLNCFFVFFFSVYFIENVIYKPNA